MNFVDHGHMSNVYETYTQLWNSIVSDVMVKLDEPLTRLYKNMQHTIIEDDFTISPQAVSDTSLQYNSLLH